MNAGSKCELGGLEDCGDKQKSFPSRTHSRSKIHHRKLSGRQIDLYLGSFSSLSSISHRDPPLSKLNQKPLLMKAM